MKILLAEDTLELSNALVTILELQGYTVDPVYDGEAALNKSLKEYYDCIILDVMMPKMDGISALEKMRSSGIVTPILMLTAKDQLEDKVNGLNSGADDYLTKPFQMKELLARVKSLIRRNESLAVKDITCGNITLNRSTMELSGEYASVLLSKKEFNLMEVFLQNMNKELTLEDISSHTLKSDDSPNESIINIYISYLKNKLLSLKANINIVKTDNGYMLEDKI